MVRQRELPRRRRSQEKVACAPPRQEEGAERPQRPIRFTRHSSSRRFRI